MAINNKKHIGKVKNTGLKCIIVFRAIYDERGNVQDDKNCLVIETDRLPDMEHDDIVRVVESPMGQEAAEFYSIAARSTFSDSSPMLQKMHKMGWLKKHPTENILVTPNNFTSVPLNEINEIVKKTNSGMSPNDIKNSMVNDTDGAPRTTTSLNSQPSGEAVPTGDGVLDDNSIAKSMLSQADTFLAEAARLKEEAFTMDPSLKPKRGRKPKAAANANT
jgi:hypothetical protein|tara:strand:- start:813 stop:1469 length:657 start_codon:yes stop_codon:yes gene_type:complete